MTKFVLKFLDEDITILQNKEAIGETSDPEEAFAFIAYTINKERIKNYKVMVLDKGHEEILDFDHIEILKNSKKYDFEDEDEDEDDSRSTNNREFDPRRSRSRGFQYTSTTTIKDYENLGLAMRDALTPEEYYKE